MLNGNFEPTSGSFADFDGGLMEGAGEVRILVGDHAGHLATVKTVALEHGYKLELVCECGAKVDAARITSYSPRSAGDAVLRHVAEMLTLGPIEHEPPTAGGC